MTYHSNPSSISRRSVPFNGMGGVSDPIFAGEEVTLTFTQASGVRGMQAVILLALKNAMENTGHFDVGGYVGWGSGSNAGKIVATGRTRSANYSLSQIAGFMPGIASTVNRILTPAKTYLTAVKAIHGADSVFQDSYTPPKATPSKVVSAPHAYVALTVCDAQRSLIAAGKSIRADGDWGTGSKTAFQTWVSALPYEPKYEVMGLSTTGSLPVFGSREDYKMDGTRLRIPAAYHRLLPAPARVACAGSSVPPRPSTVPPEEPDGGEITSPGTGEQVTSDPPWALIGGVIAAAAAAGGGYYWWRKRKYPGT